CPVVHPEPVLAHERHLLSERHRVTEQERLPCLLAQLGPWRRMRIEPVTLGELTERAVAARALLAEIADESVRAEATRADRCVGPLDEFLGQQPPFGAEPEAVGTDRRGRPDQVPWLD